jgi:hypothetical protein
MMMNPSSFFTFPSPRPFLVVAVGLLPVLGLLFVFVFGSHFIHDGIDHLVRHDQRRSRRLCFAIDEPLEGSERLVGVDTEGSAQTHESRSPRVLLGELDPLLRGLLSEHHVQHGRQQHPREGDEPVAVLDPKLLSSLHQILPGRGAYPTMSTL